MTRKHETRKRTSRTSSTPLIIILVCIATVIAIIFLTKERTSNVSPTSTGDAEIVLDSLLEEGKPVFAFYHSTDCYTCKVMMATVAEVFPEYEGSLAIVDVNVYDPANQNLLREEKIQSIPTQVFYNRAGESIVIIGVMEPDVLRQQLDTLTDG